jgi:selenocysteine lyase/cysteine desulfurase
MRKIGLQRDDLQAIASKDRLVFHQSEHGRMNDQQDSSGPTRRNLIAAASVLPIAAACATTAQADQAPPTVPAAYADLPAAEDFPNLNVTYLDSGSTHPFSVGARKAINDYLQSRSQSGPPQPPVNHEEIVLKNFAQLINATPEELAFIQSTSAGEQMAVRALGIPESGGRIVSDALHFFGSWHLYNELEKQGMEIVVVRMRPDGRIHMADLEAAVNKNTKLVSVSAVSTINGFQHDLRNVADLAHANGAHLYVDAVHAIGAVPFDVKASNIDLMATSSYKWLMGDFGLGFMYARADLIPKLKRPQAGYYQTGGVVTHLYPYDPPGQKHAELTPRNDATGLFAMGTFNEIGLAHLSYSLPFINRVGVDRIQAWRQPMMDKLRTEIPKLNKAFEPMTPDDCKTALVAFALPDARTKMQKLVTDAKLRITLSRNRFRLSPSVFNTMADIDRALDVLSSVKV